MIVDILKCPKNGCDGIVDLSEEAPMPGAELVCERCGTTIKRYSGEIS